MAMFQRVHRVPDGQREVKLNVIPVESCMTVFQQGHIIPYGQCEVKLNVIPVESCMTVFQQAQSFIRPVFNKT